MGEYVTKQQIINALTNLYDNFNEYCKLPNLEETSRYIWGKTVFYDARTEDGVVTHKKDLESVQVEISIPLDIDEDWLNHFLIEDLPNTLKNRTEDFFLEQTGRRFSSVIAHQYFLHCLNHWEMLWDENGHRIFNTEKIDGKEYLIVYFIRYMAIVPNENYVETTVDESKLITPHTPRKSLYTISLNLETCYYAKDKDEALRHFLQQLSEAVEQGRYEDYFTITEEKR